MKALDREILRLSLPSILANITVPLVGLVDTAVAGHLHSAAGTSAEFIGGISVGAMVLNVIYWNFAFLRASTGGLTAQAFGRRDDTNSILRRALNLALGFAVAMVALGWPISRIALLFRDATPNVAALAIQYVLIRIWAAPATLSLMALKGWFIGMQDTRSSMFADLTVNIVNIAASIILTLGIGNWQGLGFPGIALGTVIAQYSGLLLALGICIFRYRIPVCSRKRPETGTNASNNGVLFRKTAENGNGFFHLNANLFVRSLCMTAIYFGYTIIASRYGETMLACANIMMNLLMIFSYFTDGFAYAGEALTGRFVGEGDGGMLRAAVRGTFRWSFGVAGIWIAIYLAAGVPMLHMMTDDPTVVDACRQFLPWLAVMPLIGCAAFTWDGIYIGATASKGIRDSMLWAVAAFFVVWFAGLAAGVGGIHLLMAAYFAHLLARTAWLSYQYKRQIG